MDETISKLVEEGLNASSDMSPRYLSSLAHSLALQLRSEAEFRKLWKGLASDAIKDMPSSFPENPR